MHSKTMKAAGVSIFESGDCANEVTTAHTDTMLPSS